MGDHKVGMSDSVSVQKTPADEVEEEGEEDPVPDKGEEEDDEDDEEGATNQARAIILIILSMASLGVWRVLELILGLF